MSRPVFRGLIVFAALLAVLLAGFAYENDWFGGDTSGNAVSLPIGGDFTLTDQNGVVRHESDFRGKLMLVYFGYTYCPDVCPATLLAISQALDQLGTDASQVQPIFITVDPDRDNQAQMKLYASNFSPQLLALTGSADEIAQAERAYHVYAKKVPQTGPNNYLMDHSAFLYLMDRNGKLTALISSGADAASIAAAIKRHL
jgi:protein SCO1/2